MSFARTCCCVPMQCWTIVVLTPGRRSFPSFCYAAGTHPYLTMLVIAITGGISFLVFSLVALKMFQKLRRRHGATAVVDPVMKKKE